MNSYEKEVTKYQLASEEQTLKELKAIYRKASEDLKANIEELATRYDETGLESVIYQKKYQEAIKKQVDSALNHLVTKEYKTIDDFLNDSYNNGFIGNVFTLHNQGIPLTMPIDHEAVIRALKTDSKLSRKYYKGNPLKNRVAENYDLLKTRVRSNLSRGIAQGQSWGDVAKNIASGMNSPLRRAMNDSMRIARTEGHRVNQQGFLDAGKKAKKKGADIVKQWDATLDGNTRAEHRAIDGTIVEWDEYFNVGGEKMKAPSIGGSARNVCNCRCCLLQRAKWALDEYELEALKKRAEYFGLDKSDNFKDFKDKYIRVIPPDGAKLDKIIEKIRKRFKPEPYKDTVLAHQGAEKTIEEALSGTNPRHVIGSGYSENCQRCVQTYEQRRRGFDVEALPRPINNNTIIWGNECFIDKDGKIPEFKFNLSEKAIKSQLNTAPEGARYIIYNVWKDENASHVFIAEKNKGKIKYLDPQFNDANVESYFLISDENNFGILRIDDKEITTDNLILKEIVRKSED